MKKAMSLALAAVMSVGMLTACGGAQSTAESTGENAASDVTSEASETSSGEPETVIWYISGTEQEDHDKVMEKVNEYLLEKANIQLDLRVIADGEYDDKMKLITMSGEDYDLCFTSNWKNNFFGNMSQGSFLQLDDLIDQYGKEMKETLPEECFNAGTMNGGIYAVNNYQFDATVGAFYVRHDLVEKYGWDLSTLKTFDDVEVLLQQLVDAKDDTVVAPFFTNQIPQEYSDYEILLKQGNSIILERGDETLTAATRFQDKYYKEYCDMFREYYKKGYVQQDIATCDWENLRATGAYGIIFHSWNPTAEGTTEDTYGAKYDVVRYGEPYISASFGQSTMTAVNVNSKHPEAAVKLLNLISTDPVLFDMLVYGIEGEHYDLVDGKVQMKEDSKYNMMNRAWMLGNSFLRTSTVNDADDWKELSMSVMDEAQVTTAPGFSFDSTNYQTELAQLSSVISEFQYRWYLDDYENWAGDYTQKLSQAGLDNVLAGMQEQLDAYKANKA